MSWGGNPGAQLACCFFRSELIIFKLILFLLLNIDELKKLKLSGSDSYSGSDSGSGHRSGSGSYSDSEDY
jgi:hypothetical protein